MNTRQSVRLYGLTVNVEHWGAGVPLVALHGFTGSAATWRHYLGDAGRETASYAIDLIGHGRTDSPADLEHYRMSAVVADLVAVLDRLTLPRVALLGYSMGGRV